MSVVELGYIGLEVRDLAAWENLARDVLGFEVRARGANEPLYFRMDARHHRFALTQGPLDGLSYAGFEVPHRAALDALVQRVAEAGFAVRAGSDADKAARRVNGLVQFTDPGGFALDLYYGAEVDAAGFRPGRAMAGFKTGALGLGHIVLACPDPEAGVRLYRDVLGFRLSDTIAMGGLTAYFLHCNPRHHSVALLKPRPHSPLGLAHFMVETTTLADVGQAIDLCEEKGVPIALSLGQHTNDRMVSFYMVSPSGFRIEYGYAGLEVDDATWTVKHWTAPKFWGHRAPAPAAAK